MTTFKEVRKSIHQVTGSLPYTCKTLSYMFSFTELSQDPPLLIEIKLYQLNIFLFRN